jgi:uncharacterized protein (UPF0276 family)
MTDKPILVLFGEALRAAHQKGSDGEMLEMMVESNMVAEMCQELMASSDRTLTYAAPQIADLAIRIGWLEKR